MERADALAPCPGCGALGPDVGGPAHPHPYVGASPGCWQAYCEVLAREYGDYGHYSSVHQLSVDTYAVQHPGKPERRACQSVALHLMTLCLALERGTTAEKAARAHTYYAHRTYPWLEPPSFENALTILDVLSARDPVEHAGRVEQWARSVWQAWAPHHETVRGWLGLDFAGR